MPTREKILYPAEWRVPQILCGRLGCHGGSMLGSDRLGENDVVFAETI